MEEERFPLYKREPKPNVITNGQFVADDNSVHPSAFNVVVTGSKNDVGAGTKSISILNSSGCIVAPNLHGVTLFNCSGVTVTDSDVIYINNINQASISGTYTPTLTNTANVSASTAYQCQYYRQYGVVTVSGRVDVDPTLTATTTKLELSLPIASDFLSEENCGGVAFCPTVSGMGAAILAEKNNNTAMIQFLSGDVANNAMYFSFTYRII